MKVVIFVCKLHVQKFINNSTYTCKYFIKSAQHESIILFVNYKFENVIVYKCSFIYWIDPKIIILCIIIFFTLDTNIFLSILANAILECVIFFQAIFEKMDWDKNGTISCVEFKSYLQKMSGGETYLDHREVVKAFNQIDQDGSKQVSWQEFYVRKIWFL